MDAHESEDHDDSDSDRSSEPSSSSDDEHQWKQSVKDEYKQIQNEKRLQKKQDKMSSEVMRKNLKNSSLAGGKQNVVDSKQPKFFEIKDGLEFYKPSDKSKSQQANNIIKSEKLKKLPLLNRLQYSKNENGRESKEDTMVFRSDSFGNKQMTFVSRKEKRDKDAQKKAIEHHLERKGIRRSAGRIIKTLQKPSMKFFKKS